MPSDVYITTCDGASRGLVNPPIPPTTCITPRIQSRSSQPPRIVGRPPIQLTQSYSVDYIILNSACVHDPFPTPFSDEVLDQVVGKEAYSFTDGFPGYHQVRIVGYLILEVMLYYIFLLLLFKLVMIK